MKRSGRSRRSVTHKSGDSTALTKGWSEREKHVGHPKRVGAPQDPSTSVPRLGPMRTILFLVAGLFLMASLLIVAKMFSEHFPSAPNWAVALGLSLWLMITATNMWIGVSKAGYSVADELPILLLLFAVPAAAVVLVRWRFL